MRIFVCEFMTGGGLYLDGLPASLAHEGDLMLQALLGDLMEIPEVRLSTSRDMRLHALTMPVEVLPVGPVDDVWQSWQSCIDAVDAVWLIAPESNGVLERLSDMVVAAGKQLLGSSPEAVAISACKSVTGCELVRHGIDTAPTWKAVHLADISAGPWVAKPDDGAGCEDTCRFSDFHALQTWLQQDGRMLTHVVQTWLAGEPASISMLCHDGRAWLLSCNRQQVRLQEEVLTYHGSVLNALDDHRRQFDRVARQIAQAIPGLAGYVGVDVMVEGDRVTVLEINPRLTTSYVGLRQATGLNPARLVLDMFYNANFELPRNMAHNIVEISLDE